MQIITFHKTQQLYRKHNISENTTKRKHNKQIKTWQQKIKHFTQQINKLLNKITKKKRKQKYNKKTENTWQWQKRKEQHLDMDRTQVNSEVNKDWSVIPYGNSHGWADWPLMYHTASVHSLTGIKPTILIQAMKLFFVTAGLLFEGPHLSHNSAREPIYMTRHSNAKPF